AGSSLCCSEGRRLVAAALRMADLDFVPVGGWAITGIDGAVGRRIDRALMVRARQHGRCGGRQNQLDGRRCDGPVPWREPSLMCASGMYVSDMGALPSGITGVLRNRAFRKSEQSAQAARRHA